MKKNKQLVKYALNGQYLLDARKKAGLKQTCVAKDGLLTQGRLSDIEHGKALPTKEQTIHLANCYKMSRFELEEVQNEPNQKLDTNQHDNKRQILSELRQAVYVDQFHQLKQGLLYTKEMSRLFTHQLDKQLLDWYRGIVELECHQDYEIAYHYFSRAKSSSEETRQWRLLSEILNSLGAYFINLKQHHQAHNSLLQAQKCLDWIHPDYPFHDIRIRTFYNLTINSFHQENFHDCIRYSSQAHFLCREHQTSYLDGELHFMNGLGNLHAKPRNEEKARHNLMHASHMFEVQNKLVFKNLAEENLKSFKLK